MVSSPMKQILTLLLTLALLGCNSAPPAEQSNAPDPQADKDAINKLRDDFIAAFNAGDAEKMGQVYAETAVVMDPGQPTVEGRAAIVEHNKMFLDQNTVKVSVNPRATNVSGDLGFDEGTYTMEVTPKAAGQKPTTVEGRYLVVLQRGADGWRVLEDMGNSAAPPPPPAPAKK
jgi:uncharacterized protein (TIGR02246 family)